MNHAPTAPSSAFDSAPPSGSDSDDEPPPPDIKSGGDRYVEGTDKDEDAEIDGDEGLKNTRGVTDDDPNEDEQKDENESHNADKDAASRVETTNAAAAKIDDGERSGERKGEGALRMAAAPQIGLLEKEEFIASIASAPSEESVGGQTPEGGTVFDKEQSGDAVTDSSAARKAPSPPGDNKHEGKVEGNILAADEKFGKEAVLPHGTDGLARGKCVARRSRRFNIMESEEEEKQEISEPTETPHVPEIAPVLAAPEKVSATAPDGRIFAGSFMGSGERRGSAGSGDGADATGGADDAGNGPAPGSFEVPGLEEEGASPSASASSRDDTPAPIFEGTLVRAREQVYDCIECVVIPSEEAAGGGRCSGPLKSMLAIASILCISAAVVAVAVTLSGQQSTSISGLDTRSSVPTHKPSSNPTKKELLILNHLENIFGNKVHQDRAPYANATHWILSDDHTIPANGTRDFLTHRYILALLYYSTNGGDWKRKPFLTLDHHCTWYGITCDDNTKFIRSIWMWDNNMVGTLPSELGLMSSLERLSMYWNDLTGTLPSALGDLTALRSLSAYRNDLTGTLPDELYNLENLTWLDLENNAFNGTISPLIGQLSNLSWLYIYGNSFGGAIPTTIGHLTSLRSLVASENQLTGPLPDELYNLKNLTWLDLWKNALNGTISPLIGRLSKLTSLDIRGNSIGGTIPTPIGNLTSLRYLEANDNELTGPLPDKIYELENLSYLELKDNALTGTISSLINKLQNLRSFLIKGNFFMGTIPTELAGIETIARINVRGNNFTGTISEAFCKLGQLWMFYADCGPTDGTGPPAVECECCTHCCDTARRDDTCQRMG